MRDEFGENPARWLDADLTASGEGETCQLDIVISLIRGMRRPERVARWLNAETWLGRGEDGGQRDVVEEKLLAKLDELQRRDLPELSGDREIEVHCEKSATDDWNTPDTGRFDRRIPGMPVCSSVRPDWQPDDYQPIASHPDYTEDDETENDDAEADDAEIDETETDDAEADDAEIDETETDDTEGDETETHVGYHRNDGRDSEVEQNTLVAAFGGESA